jgi:hypothetical protein
MSIALNTDFKRSNDDLFEKVIQKSQYYNDIFAIVECISSAYIAGGFLLHWWKPEEYQTKDIDIFFTSPDAVDKMREELKFRGWIKKVVSPYMCEDWTHVDYKWTIQLIIGVIYSEPFHIIDGFDLRCCMVAYDGKNLYRHKEAMNDIEKSLINIHRIRDVDHVKKHILRYMEKGFKLTPEAFNTLFGAIKPKTPKPKKEIPIISDLNKFKIRNLSKRNLRIEDELPDYSNSKGY